MSEVILCKDCRYYKYTFAYGNYDRCTYNNEFDIIRGKRKTEFCEINRKYDHKCGANAKHFVPRISWMDRWFRQKDYE